MSGARFFACPLDDLSVSKKLRPVLLSNSDNVAGARPSVFLRSVDFNVFGSLICSNFTPSHEQFYIDMIHSVRMIISC